MKKLSLNQMETSNGGKFMGHKDICTRCILGAQECYTQGYFFFIKTYQSEAWPQAC